MSIRTTVLFQTFKRPDACQRLIASIQKFYPDYWPNFVIMNDDSEYDRGISWGRNFLVTQAKTEYIIFVDDDFIFTEKTDIQKLETMMDNSDNDILAFDCGRGYFGTFSIENGIVNMLHKKNEKGKYDYVPQIFIAKREALLKHKWDETVKTGDHFPFFYLNHKTLKSDYTVQVSIIHAQVTNPEYHKHRERGMQYVKTFMKKHGIEKIINGNEIIIAK